MLSIDFLVSAAFFRIRGWHALKDEGTGANPGKQSQRCDLRPARRSPDWNRTRHRIRCEFDRYRAETGQKSPATLLTFRIPTARTGQRCLVLEPRKRVQAETCQGFGVSRLKSSRSNHGVRPASWRGDPNIRQTPSPITPARKQRWKDVPPRYRHREIAWRCRSQEESSESRPGYWRQK